MARLAVNATRTRHSTGVSITTMPLTDKPTYERTITVGLKSPPEVLPKLYEEERGTEDEAARMEQSRAEQRFFSGDGEGKR